MAYVDLVVQVNKRDRRPFNAESDQIAAASIKVGGASGTEINTSNVVTKDNSQILTNKSIDAASNPITNIPGSALTANAKQVVLESKNVAAWGVVLNKSVAEGNTDKNVTAEIMSAAQTDTETSSSAAKGVLTTGTGAGGAGTQNYKVTLRDATTQDPIADGSNGAAYAELTHANAVIATGDITTTLASDQVVGALTAFQTDYQIGDAVLDSTGALIGFVASIESDTAMTLVANALVAVTNQTSYRRRRYTITFKTQAGAGFAILAGTTAIDFMFGEVFDIYDKPWKSDLYGFSFVDVVGVTGTHSHSANDINSGTLANSLFSAYSDLVDESKIGSNSDQVAAGNHAHAYSDITGTKPGYEFSEITGSLDPSQFSAYADLVAETKIGANSDQVAAGDHGHALSNLTGTLPTSMFSAYDDLVAETKIGTSSDQVAAGNHTHSYAFSEITGSLDPSQFSAYADLVAETKIGTSSDQVAAGNHTHSYAFSEITGSLDPSQFSAYADLVAESKIGSASDQIAAGDHAHETRDYYATVSVAQGKVCYVSAAGSVALATPTVSNIHLKRLVVAAENIPAAGTGKFFKAPGSIVPVASGWPSNFTMDEVYLYTNGDVTQNIADIASGKIIALGYGAANSSWEFMQPTYVGDAA